MCHRTRNCHSPLPLRERADERCRLRSRGDGGSGLDGGAGSDSSSGHADTGGGTDAASGNDAATSVDAFVGTDAAVSNGCELGNTYPTLHLSLLHVFSDLPVSLVMAPGRTDIFVVTRGGRVFVMNATSGTVLATPFVDISSRLGGVPSASAEWGLLGMAFHPDYQTNGLFYLAYTPRAGMNPVDCMGTAPGPAYEDRVAAGVRATADTGTWTADIFTIPDPRSNHNGGELAFGPDGFLYYSVGDGGEQGDPCHRALDTTLPLGKIHRFQVGPGIATYNAAPGNPFIAGGGLATIWAYGVRNPWRFSWDRRTHDMYIADVGQNMWEEIDFVAAGTGAGSNFGWSTCEGTHNFNGTCTAASGIAPIAEYTHSGDPIMHTAANASITGGYVYRGAAIPGLRGGYVYADEVTSYFAALRNCPGMPVTPTSLASISNAQCQNPTTFGEDANGELLVGCYGDSGVYRITP